MDEVRSLGDWLANHDGVAAIVFTDVVGSTRLLFTKETLDYRSMLRSHRTRARQLIAEQQGRLVSDSGDELLAVFPSATTAYSYANVLVSDPGHAGLRVRAGIHLGPVRAEGRDLVGRHVHLAARVMQHARGPELWVHDAAKVRLEAESPGLASSIWWVANEECELKGIPDVQRLWRAGTRGPS